MFRAKFSTTNTKQFFLCFSPDLIEQGGLLIQRMWAGTSTPFKVQLRIIYQSHMKCFVIFSENIPLINQILF